MSFRLRLRQAGNELLLKDLEEHTGRQNINLFMFRLERKQQDFFKYKPIILLSF